jgi:hypothetical protein
MKNSIKILAAIVASCVVLWGCPKPVPAPKTVDKIILPTDAMDSCTLTTDVFDKWFEDGKAKTNGLVTPANSLTFPHNNNCDFYQWSEHMFLWITSPHKGIGKTVLESPLFYDVLPADDDTSGQRKLVPHTASMGLRMSSHIIKNGPHRLPVIIDKDGRMLEIENAGPQVNAKPLVKGLSNKTAVEVDHVTKDAKGPFVFMDKEGKVIEQPKAVIRHKFHKENFVQRFTVGNQSVLLDMNGKQIQTEAGQATGDVLMAQGGSLVYYLTTVNDVYAYFATGAINGKLKHTQFPTDTASLAAVVAYAKANGVELPDSTALAIELKTAWVEASKVPNPGDYVTTMATIPKYDTTHNKRWIPKGDTLVKMALVGMHIVGSAAGHPEMIWATFEHESNTPNAAYDYVDKNHKIKTVTQDSGSGWLFSSNGADPKPNVPHMNNFIKKTFTPTGDTINAEEGYKISPSNSLAALPWGSQRGTVTNPQNGSSAASNSEIISLNYAIQQLMPAGDVRKNYLLVGATWTAGGVGPTGLVYGSGGIQGHSKLPGASIGTSVLANTTMETYFQSGRRSCFTCHSTPENPSVDPDSISHIFGSLQPLITLHEALDKKKKK